MLATPFVPKSSQGLPGFRIDGGHRDALGADAGGAVDLIIGKSTAASREGCIGIGIVDPFLLPGRRVQGVDLVDRRADIKRVIGIGRGVLIGIRAIDIGAGLIGPGGPPWG